LWLTPRFVWAAYTSLDHDQGDRGQAASPLELSP